MCVSNVGHPRLGCAGWNIKTTVCGKSRAVGYFCAKPFSLHSCQDTIPVVAVTNVLHSRAAHHQLEPPRQQSQKSPLQMKLCSGLFVCSHCRCSVPAAVPSAQIDLPPPLACPHKQSLRAIPALVTEPGHFCSRVYLHVERFLGRPLIDQRCCIVPARHQRQPRGVPHVNRLRVRCPSMPQDSVASLTNLRAVCSNPSQSSSDS